MDRTPEELAEVQRVHDVLSKAMDRELWQIAELMVGKRDDQLFGETEFALRDKVLRRVHRPCKQRSTTVKKGVPGQQCCLPKLRPRRAFRRLADADRLELDGADGG